jgi:hypothetical protein
MGEAEVAPFLSSLAVEEHVRRGLLRWRPFRGTLDAIDAIDGTIGPWTWFESRHVRRPPFGDVNSGPSATSPDE